VKFKLPVAEKKDSQGICFLGAVDLKDFLKWRRANPEEYKEFLQVTGQL
jgi:tRNA U34 2-thiouridine synthase MnmA/TrmU